MKNKIIILILALIIFQNSISAFLISDQGTNVREVATGNLTELANLTISIYDASTGGNLVFEENSTNAISNGSWNLMIDPDLEYGKSYWKDYKINGEDLDFDANERLEIQSSVGNINNESFINFSLIESCSAGSSIRLIYENGSVVCETDDNSGTPDLTNYALTNESETFTGNITTTQTGLFRWLGSLANRITKIFAQDIDFNGTINGTGNINITGNITADYFYGDGSQLTNLPSGTDSWSENYTNYYNKSDIYNKSEIDNSNSSWSSTYNETYHNFSYNHTTIAQAYADANMSVSVLQNILNTTGLYSTFNITYESWNYNQTLATFNMYNATWDNRELLTSINTTDNAIELISNQNITFENVTATKNITVAECIIFGSGGKICSA